jgi:Putative Ig domain
MTAVSFRACRSRTHPARARASRRCVPTLECLEARNLLDGGLAHPNYAVFHEAGAALDGAPAPTSDAFTPAGLRHAYGIDLLSADGTGETIAIVDAYDNPNFVSRSPTLPVGLDNAFLSSDLHQFDVQYGLPEPPGFFTKVDQSGGTSYPGTDPAGAGNNNWEAEEALDVEWAHALAPGAKIILVETRTNANSNVFAGITWAGGQSGAQVVTISWGIGEYSRELSNDAYFVQPSTYGVTYVAATGDAGAPGSYPAFSPNVLAVGGTTLHVDGNGNYSSESGWSSGGGGISPFEPQPAYQGSLTQVSPHRAIPDVSFDADPATGVSIYDSYNGAASGGPWYQLAGTSLGSPGWAALVALADQIRASANLPSLNGAAQTLPGLYRLPASAVHDVTTGNNGFAAGPGYDLVTGIGTPIVNKLVPDLAGLVVVAGSTPANGAVLSTAPTEYTILFSDPINPNTLSASALQVNGVAASSATLDTTGTVATFTFSSNPVTAPGPQTLALAAGVLAAANVGYPNAPYTATFTINPPPIITTLNLGHTTVGLSFSQTILASGGTGSLTFSATGNLPDGVTLSSQGVLGGTAVVSGSYSFTVTVADGTGAVVSQNFTLVVDAGPFSQYLVTLAGASTIQAGKSFLVAAQAVDAFGNAVASYDGPAAVTLSLTPSPTSSAANFPATVSLSATGLGVFLGTVQQVGSYTITAHSDSFSGTSSPITVTPGPAALLAFTSQPQNTPTGVAMPAITVQVQDLFGNPITSDNTYTVTLTIASGPGTFTGGNTTVTVHNGAARFTNLTFAIPGSYTLSARASAPLTGPHSNVFIITPLQVAAGSFIGSPTGFALRFNAPFLINPSTPVLYGHGSGTLPTASSVLLTTDPGNLNDIAAYVNGSLVLDPINHRIRFLTTTMANVANYGPSPLLPDGVYTAVIRSSAATAGFQALASGGGYLDGLGTGKPGSGDFMASFTVNAGSAHEDVVWVPPTADGPGQPLNAPGNNQVGGGYPIYLSDSTGVVTDVQVTFHYTPALLTVTGVTGAGFSLLGSSTPGQAVLQYHGPALPAGVQTPIGYLVAKVPAGSVTNPVPYRVEHLLHLSNVLLNGGDLLVTTADALHLVAYVGDADGNGMYNSNDAMLISRTLLSTDSGFSAYPLVDPAIVADTDGYGFIPADAALQVNEAGTGLPTATLATPPIPPGVFLAMGTANVSPGPSLMSGLHTLSRGLLAPTAPLEVAPPPGANSSARILAPANAGAGSATFNTPRTKGTRRAPLSPPWLLAAPPDAASRLVALDKLFAESAADA